MKISFRCRQPPLPLLLVLVLALVPTARPELLDDVDRDVERFCFPQQLKDTRRSCECSNESAPPWGVRAVRIDCSYKGFGAADFPAETLPLYVDSVDLSWNALDRVPAFASDSLRLLNLMHNNVSSLAAGAFATLPGLRELFLSWNSVQAVEAGAFEGLAHLQVLDLSHNNLHALAPRLFGPLLVLESLSLSWNRQLNRSEGIQERDFHDALGVNRKLRVLRLEACGLVDIVLAPSSPLVELNLRRNRLERVPAQLPAALERLDLSDNPLPALRPADTAPLAHVRELLLEDMPRLEAVEAGALAPLQGLRRVSFQNSRRLAAVDGHAFGANATRPPGLASVIFRGTAVRSLNATLEPVLRPLAELDLNGAPLRCDCDLLWLKALPLETQGRCLQPSRLRGVLVSSADAKDFSCDRWPRWVYGLIVLGLIFLCSAGIYFIVMGLRPHRGVTMRRKVGAGSPYARVTIEPNRQENNY